MGSKNKTVFTFLVGWLILILILVTINRTQLGNRLITYTLWLAAVLLVITNANFFVNLYGSTGGTS